MLGRLCHPFGELYWSQLAQPRRGSAEKRLRIRTLTRMGTTGLIFGALVAAWLAYLVPWYLSHRDQTPVDEEHNPTLSFTRDAKLLQSGEETLDLEPDWSDVAVATPLTRAAGRREVRRAAQTAARRRRNVLLVLVVSVVGLSVTTGLGLTLWWAPIVAAGVLALWLGVARVSVVRMHRQLRSRLASIDLADDEATVAIVVGEPMELPDAEVEDYELSVEISGPVPVMSLWEPIPVTTSTYVSKPLAQRTVRTIDLSAPAAPASRVPVTADAGLDDVADHRRAVGE